MSPDRWCWVLFGLVGGCTGLNPLFGDAGGDTDPTGDFGSTTVDASGPGSSPSSSEGSTTRPGETLVPDDTGGSTAETGHGTGDTGTMPQTTGTTADPDPYVCSTYEQDCPADHKCMPWADDGGVVWNALDCFPLEPNPQVAGDPCLVEGSPTSGSDNCDQTSMCWEVDPKTNEGFCVPFCTGTPDSPTCDDPQDRCVQTNDGIIALCLPSCDPLIQDCPAGELCAPDDDGFVCMPDVSPMKPQAGLPCEFLNECGVGLLCVIGSSVDGCAGGSCCTPFCDLSDEDFCPGPELCIPYFEKGAAPAGYEDVGFCGILL